MYQTWGAASAALARLSYVCVLEASIAHNPIIPATALWSRLHFPDYLRPIKFGLGLILK